MISDAKHFIELVGSRMNLFLEKEVGISALSTEYSFHDVQRLKLNYLTSIMAVEGQYKVIFAFSFEHQLITAIMQAYTAELDVNETNSLDYLEETAADTINIVLGNTLKYFQISGQRIDLTPPIVIDEAKTIFGNKLAKFLSAKINTASGEMQIYCIGPKDLFDKKLNFIGDKDEC